MWNYYDIHKEEVSSDRANREEKYDEAISHINKAYAIITVIMQNYTDMRNQHAQTSLKEALDFLKEAK